MSKRRIGVPRLPSGIVAHVIEPISISEFEAALVSAKAQAHGDKQVAVLKINCAFSVFVTSDSWNSLGEAREWHHCVADAAKRLSDLLGQGSEFPDDEAANRAAHLLADGIEYSSDAEACRLIVGGAMPNNRAWLRHVKKAPKLDVSAAPAIHEVVRRMSYGIRLIHELARRNDRPVSKPQLGDPDEQELVDRLAEAYELATGRVATVTKKPDAIGAEQYGGPALLVLRRVLGVFLQKIEGKGITLGWPSEERREEALRQLKKLSDETQTALAYRLSERRKRTRFGHSKRTTKTATFAVKVGAAPD